MKMGKVADLNVDVEGLKAAVAVNQVKVGDVGVLGPENACSRAERAGYVADDNREPRLCTFRALTPR